MPGHLESVELSAAMASAASPVFVALAILTETPLLLLGSAAMAIFLGVVYMMKARE